MTVFNSKIRLTPHQIDAALFAFKTPINKGVILADEVGWCQNRYIDTEIRGKWYNIFRNCLIN